MLKIMVRVINDLYGEEIFGTFYDKETIKTNQKEFRIEKIIKRKGDELYVKLKGYNKSFNSWINKKISLYKMSYISEPYTRSKSKIIVKLGFSSYAAKSDLKKVTGVDTSSFNKKADLASLKSDVHELDTDKFKNVPFNLNSLKNKVDKLDVDKLKPVPTDFKKLSDVIDTEVVKKDLPDNLVEKVNVIDICGLVKKQIITERSMRLKLKYLVLLA